MYINHQRPGPWRGNGRYPQAPDQQSNVSIASAKTTRNNSSTIPSTMHFLKSTTLLLAATLATLVSAVPTPASNEPVRRACTTVTPTIARVSEAQPVESYLPGFKISQGAGGTQRNDMFVEFSIPAGSWGCSLSYSFPAGYDVDVTGSPAPWVDVYAVQGPLSRSPHGVDISWGYCPEPLYLVGSTRFESSPTQTTTRVINSFGCADTMTYRLRIGKFYNNAASVEFAQTAAAGLRMTYGC